MALCTPPDKAERSDSRHSPHQELLAWLRGWEARCITQQEQMASLIQKLHQEQLDDRSRRVQDQTKALEAAFSRLMYDSDQGGAAPPTPQPPTSHGVKDFLAKVVEGAADFVQPVQNEAPEVKLTEVPEEDIKKNGDENVLRNQLAGAVGWKNQQSSRRSVSSIMFQVEAKGPIQDFFVKIVHSRVFDSITALIVIANTTMIGVMVDLDLTRALAQQAPLEWEALCNLIFTCLFTVEVAMRLTSDRMFFFIGNTKWWNFFDIIVIFAGITEAVDLTDMNLAPVRLLRLLRVVRILRIIRVFRFFRQLRMMALSMTACWSSLSWAFVLMFIVLYTFAMVLMEGAREYFRNEPGALQNQAVKEPVELWWAGLARTMYTLAQVVTGGVSWYEPALPFDQIGSAYSAVFTLFVAFVLFGLLNVLVGIFVQSTAAVADYDKEFVIQEEMSAQDSAMNKLRELFVHVDMDNSGTITWSELKENLNNECVKAYFSLVQIDVQEAEGLFQLLDVDESGEVGIEEFIMGCMRLKGTAKSIDLATLLYENKRLHTLIRRFMQEMDDKIAKIHDNIAARGNRRPSLPTPPAERRS